jgi:hypothetical protein
MKLKLPRYSLRTMLIGFTVLCAAAGWSAAQLRWIHQRHQFIESHRASSGFLCFDTKPAPWPLEFFGEHGWQHSTMYVHRADLPAAKELFPEVPTIMPVEGTEYEKIRIF